MVRLSTVERRKDRLELVREAGHGQVSAPAVAAGVLSAFGALMVVVGLVVAIAEAVGVDARGFTHSDWRAVGLACAIATGVVVCLAWAFGGYVAGRMARRAGARHGVLVFVASAVMLGVAALVVWAEHGTSTLRDALAHQGAPTARGDWWDIAALAGLLSFVGALFGSTLGAVRGERWHQHLVERALDPAYGPDAEARATAGQPVDPVAEREWIQPTQAREPAAVDLRDAEASEAAPPAGDGDTVDRDAVDRDAVDRDTVDEQTVQEDAVHDRRVTTHPGGAWRDR